MIYIYPYKMGSQSAKLLRAGLSTALGKRIKMVHPTGKFRPRRDDIVINWGNNTQPNWKFTHQDLNAPACVVAATNKAATFGLLKVNNVPTPDYTQVKDEAQAWVNDGCTVVVRHTTTGHSGQGIEIIETGEVPEAPLYVKYKKKRSEWRVHVCKGKVIDTCQKKKRNATERPASFNTRIRSYDNGWVFCRLDIVPDLRRDELAINSIKAIGLDFGAVDIIYNESEDTYYTLEVNTAPGIEGTTLERYVEALCAV